MIDYTAILMRKYQGSEWTLNGDDYQGLIWISSDAKPTKKVLDDLWEIVLSEIEAEKNYKTTARAALLERLGITADEAALLLE